MQGAVAVAQVLMVEPEDMEMHLIRVGEVAQESCQLFQARQLDMQVVGADMEPPVAELVEVELVER